MSGEPEVPPVAGLIPFAADGGFYGWSRPTDDGLHTIVVSNEDGEDPTRCPPGEKWSVGVLRDADAEAVLEFGYVEPEELEGLLDRLAGRAYAAE